jgi:CRISPR-associated endonuclease/helicase Cas3
MKPTKFQSVVQDRVRRGESILLVAPTGLGKTFAVVGDVQGEFHKIVYAVPLRALGGGIRDAVQDLNRSGQQISAVIHHGDTQESLLFSEEVIVTTYDQVVCGVPGLPLSLPLKAGHAVAGALLMSRLVLDEVHLAWGISDQALTILLAIIEFRKKLGLQTVVLTATLPDDVGQQIHRVLGLTQIVVGEGDLKDDEGLRLRNDNRKVQISLLELKTKGKDQEKQLDYTPLDEKLKDAQGKRIYFANTVERIQTTFDRLISRGMDPSKITVLHNRMPHSWRAAAEQQVDDRFGKNGADGDWLLLTNQVAEAGLDISASLVISDPAPVDTLVQRAGRCARWFRHGKTEGQFSVIKLTPNTLLKDWAPPYRERCVAAAIKTMPENSELAWDVERQWINNAWGLQLDGQGKLPKNPSEKRREQIENTLAQTAFALNLFDRAAQEHRPGEIASVFREILSVEIAVEVATSDRDLQELLDLEQRPETSSVSLGRAWQLLREAGGAAKVIRYEEGDLQIEQADWIRAGDVLIVPSTVAYLHSIKGLCFGDGSQEARREDVSLNSEWKTEKKGTDSLPREGGRRQGLIEHVFGVMEGTHQRLTSKGAYRDTLVQILKALEPGKDPETLADVVAQIATLAAGFHDLGKTDLKWQDKARKIDPECPDGLIGRTLRTAARIGIPHTPPGYLAILKTCELLMGPLNSSEFLIRAIALAAARHHSSLLNPATVDYQFEPHSQASQFVQSVLEKVQAPEEIKSRAQDILDAARKVPAKDTVPLLLPNDDLFPLYALVGRAILMADRENAAGKPLEQWGAR